MAPPLTTLTVALSWLSSACVLTEGHEVKTEGALDAALGQKRLSEDSELLPKPSERNATVKLYSGSYASNKRGSCSPSSPAEVISLSPEVCLSGDYYFSTNVALHEAPVCRDGSAPYMAIFNRRGCTGNRAWFDIGRSEIPTCFDKKKWPLGDADDADTSWSHWSLMFYCTHLSTAMATDGAHSHRAARPPSISRATRGPKDGLFQVFNTKAHCESGVRMAKEEWSHPGIFLNLPAYIDRGTGYVKVAEPAYCEDGSRAQLARYEDVDCASHHHEGTHDHHATLTDVTDEEGFGCVDVTAHNHVAFSCTGLGKMPLATGFTEEGTEKSLWYYLLLALSGLSLVIFLFVVGLGKYLRVLALPMRRLGVRVPAPKAGKMS